ncbi:bifunctional [glutamate--ammonia ligase]-adenylyl-L-tyrosine phosphorylase/[glutamate--ammonia-ligase] adenylyltransferase [Planctomyces sp. SH-PL62]|uniref:bifunctional [glutamate--ammonia ligase]-adenylyl-L-tyrosine phosphorylase/[glutamate--ammonia-ligase] adenylyltransferase n=1 Tax=Planctomyces sp. SH-PL62 TaxID=1636152 RepID=UPI00078B622D|nr:bifunctional [glutamate--ammonia ligase]-adenylyl-L-tyrosine phosphorylase/[glutamate--ammonia-ligase] adenylyltransferase [Planctomyces sp. SH-PL62]AMV38922.1 Glutamate-ammonia-ligase adenylyltransferase [Planctomyces sp. SH-PL62]
MNLEWFVRQLEFPTLTRKWLQGLGVRDLDRGVRDVEDLARHAGPDARRLLARLAGQFDYVLPRCSDPGMALTNFERYVAALSDPAAGLARLADRPRTTEILLQVFSTSQHLGELLIRSPDLIDWLQSGAERRDRATLSADLWSTLTTGDPEEDPRLVLRRFRLRETLRIGYNDIVRGFPLEVTTTDLSHLADACVEAATRLARIAMERRYGAPMRPHARTSRFTVLGLGKLGGVELNYSSDIDLIFLYDEDGSTSGLRPVTNAEFFARMSSEVVRLLSDHTTLGMAYRVDMRLRPEGDQGVLARSFDATMGYYVTRGRTWERQALIKCRPIAGDPDLGRSFIEAVTPFVYRRYLSASEISEIKSLKRRIEQRTVSAGRAEVEVKTGRGGIRDVEFVVQFLQLLHGGEHPVVRSTNTLEALDRLEQVGSLTAEERSVMDDTYRFLRQVEHRLQILFDRQTHEMPRDLEELRTLAIRMGYVPLSVVEDRTGPAHRFLADYRSKTELNRRILNHILHDAFLQGDGDGAEADPVVDLVLDPHTTEEQASEVLSRYPFRDRAAAYNNLLALAREDFAFLSHARCRHFLASIAPRLLQAVGRTAEPDLTLANLEKVSASLGAKAILWELFNINPPSLRLYVDLCATSQLVCRILTDNPGMIDDLMDSLIIDRPFPGAAIKSELAELTRGAEDQTPILWSFRNKEWVRIGTRDVLAREPIREVARELADVAEAIVGQVARDQWARRVERFGSPTRADDGRRDRWAIVALGKLGGRALNYHSDLDLIFLHESAGVTTGGDESTTNEQFVTDVVQRFLKAMDRDAATGILYQVDTRLRPHGAAGPLVNTLSAFTSYYETSAQSWERLALTRGRVVFATGGFGRHVTDAIRAILSRPVDAESLGADVVDMRRRLEDSRGRKDIKRGVGGLADVEFAVHYLTLVHAARHPDVLRPNTWEALDALAALGVLSPALHDELRDIYNFLFSVDARLRLIHDRAGAVLPEDPDDLTRLARRLKYDAADPTLAVSEFLLDSARFTTRARAIFQQLVPGPPAPSP